MATLKEGLIFLLSSPMCHKEKKALSLHNLSLTINGLCPICNNLANNPFVKIGELSCILPLQRKREKMMLLKAVYYTVVVHNFNVKKNKKNYFNC
jgi:hypothetical protein